MDIVIIVFERDLPMLEVQSRSIAKFCKLDVDRILIVNNYSHERFRNDLYDYMEMLDYGPFNHKIEIVDRMAISDFEITDPLRRKIAPGYMLQMIYKLLIARHVTTPEYMILDAKTFFVRDITDDDVYHNGKLRTSLANAWEPDFWYPAFITALDEFDVNTEENRQSWVLNQTPYLIHTHIVRELLDHIDDKHGDFCRWFDSKIISGGNGYINEFFLIQAYILMKYGDLGSIFWHSNQRLQRQMWEWEPEKITGTIMEYWSIFYGMETNYFSHGFHRQVWLKMNADQREEIPVWWEKLGIIPASRGRNIIGDIIRLNSYPWPNNLPADQIVNGLKRLTADNTTTIV